MQPFVFSLRPPRHPLLRTLLAIAGLVLLGMFAVVGAVIGALVLLAFGLRRLLMQSRRATPPPDPQSQRSAPDNVIEGEYSVVRKSQANLSAR